MDSAGVVGVASVVVVDEMARAVLILYLIRYLDGETSVTLNYVTR